MGGQACVLYGGAEFSRDTDIVVLADDDNLCRLASALRDLDADVIAVPPFERRYLEGGHAIHFRCRAAGAEGLHVDVMAKIRGLDDFETLWRRRTTIETDDGPIELLALPDLVTAKKTQSDKDWPMITRLVEAHHAQFAPTDDASIIDFWLRELRTPVVLIEVARAAPDVCRAVIATGPCWPTPSRATWLPWLWRSASKRIRNARSTVLTGRRCGGNWSGCGMSGEADPARRLRLLCMALMGAVLWAPARADEADLPMPDPVAIRDVLADVNAQSRRRVRLRGVVTWRGGGGLMIQDDSGGIWIDRPREAPGPVLMRPDDEVLPRLATGFEVEVVGWTNRGGHSPNISPESIRILGEKPEPEPRAADPERFFSGADDCLRVCVAGLVQGVRDVGGDWQLILDDRGRRFSAFVPKKIVPQAPEHLVDAYVRMVGVAAARFNTRGEHRGTRLLVAHAADIHEVRPAIGGPFDAPEVPLHAIAQYAPEPASGRRIRTQGIVTFSEPRRFLYLQQGTMGVRVETASAERYAPGDVVELAGFVDRHGDVAGIVEAVVRRLASDRSLEPIRIAPDEIVAINRKASYHGAVAAPGDYKGCLVTFSARVVDVQAAGDRGTVLLHSGSTGVVAVAGPETFRQVRDLEPGSEVQASGIVQEGTPDADEAWALAPLRAGQLQLLLRSAADIRLVRAPSWWTPTRLAVALAAVAGVAGGSLAWVVFLRRQVARQLALIETKLQAEAATEERHRIAREFHDTLEQDLAGITLRLDAAAHRTADERSRTVLEEQRGLIARLQSETHDFLWDLRDPARHDGSLVESLASQTAYLQSLTDVPIRLDAAADLPRVPPLVQYQLLRIVREAVSNAVRHGDPTGIDLRLRASAAGLSLSVADDGRGFDVASRQAVAGHFGVRGMRERVRRIGAVVEIESQPGQGTRVEVRVPATSLTVSPVPGLSKSTMAAATVTADHDKIASA